MAEKRRLPVIPAKSENADEPPRPPWHWVGFGTTAIFGAWLPLAYAAEALKKKVVFAWVGQVGDVQIAPALAALSAGERSRLGAALVLLTSLAMGGGAFAGGYLVGRWGGVGVGTREAALAGLMSGIIVSGLASTRGEGSWVVLGAGAVGACLVLALFAALGGGVGARRRARVGE